MKASKNFDSFLSSGQTQIVRKDIVFIEKERIDRKKILLKVNLFRENLRIYDKFDTATFFGSLQKILLNY